MMSEEFSAVFEDHSQRSSEIARSVTFGKIQIREFERIVGDHPMVSDLRGPPLSIGWGYNECDAVPVDEFESWRCCRRSIRLEPLNGEIRGVILFDATAEEIKEALLDVQRTKKQRRETVRRQGSTSKKIKSAFGKLKRFF